MKHKTNVLSLNIYSEDPFVDGRGVMLQHDGIAETAELAQPHST